MNIQLSESFILKTVYTNPFMGEFARILQREQGGLIIKMRTAALSYSLKRRGFR